MATVIETTSTNNNGISSTTMTAQSPSPPQTTTIRSNSPSQTSSAKQLDKLRRFLSTLYYFGSDISNEIGERVRALVFALIVGWLRVRMPFDWIAAPFCCRIMLCLSKNFMENFKQRPIFPYDHLQCHFSKWIDSIGMTETVCLYLVESTSISKRSRSISSSIKTIYQSISSSTWRFRFLTSSCSGKWCESIERTDQWKWKKKIRRRVTTIFLFFPTFHLRLF